MKPIRACPSLPLVLSRAEKEVSDMSKRWIVPDHYFTCL